MRSDYTIRNPKVPRSAASAVALVWLAACSGGSSGPDAGPECWPGGGTPTAGAEVELGVGLEFTELATDQEVQLVAGGQGGFHLEVNARIRGMTPGEAGDPRPGNPFTLFRAFTDDGVDITLQNCTFPLGYGPVGDGSFGLPSGRFLRVLGGAVANLSNSPARIQVEVLDADGRYAIDERRIFVLPPEGFEPADAGPPDAGADAGG